MTGKDKTAKSGKSKKALEAEFAAAVAAADNGDSFTCAASNTAKGGSAITVRSGPNPMYDDRGNYINPPEEKRDSGSATVSKKEMRDAKKAAKRATAVKKSV